ncbi:MAG TPA: hypothetical protein DD435_05375 [Cyanobacteria bacterium UBA8530]|nr:hypothetical protein [Cyanobacteria bacterium UBA8530]
MKNVEEKGKKKSKFLGALYLASAAIIWGVACTVGKAALAVMAPMPLLSIRFAIAFLIFLLFALSRESIKVPLREIPLLALVGLIGFPLSIGAQFIGTDLTNASLASIVTATSPVLIGIFAWMLLKEPMGARKWAALGTAIFGMILLAGLPVLQGRIDGKGILFLCLAALTWALYTVLGKKAALGHSPLVVQVYAMGFGLLGTIPFGILGWRPLPPPSLSLFAAIFYLSVLSTALAFYLWNLGFTMLSSGTGALFFFLQPLVGVFVAWLALGEKLTIPQLLGSLAVLVGIFIALGTEK